MKFYFSIFLSLYALLYTHYSLAQHRTLFFSSSASFNPMSVQVDPLFQWGVSRSEPSSNFLIRNNTSAEKPFFCNLEDKMHKRFNVWIKFRAGSDDIYRKMIDMPYIFLIGITPKKEN